MSILTKLNTPIFYAEGEPVIDYAKHTISVGGLVDNPSEFTVADVRAMEKTVIDGRLTSVSGWSVKAEWGGVLFSTFAGVARPRREGTHVTFTSVGGYDTTVSMKDLLEPRVLLCYEAGGDELEIEYGGPIRMFIPQLWGYKSCKGIAKITFVEKMIGGYWEDRGYPREALIQPGSTLDVNTHTERKYTTTGEITEF